MSAHARRPLVLSATTVAVEQAANLLPGRVLENAVEQALMAGRLSPHRPAEGRTAVVSLGGGLVAIVKRTRSPLTGRRAWTPISVRLDTKAPSCR